MNVQPVGAKRSRRTKRNAKVLASNAASREASRALATAAFARAINRAAIRLERNKDLASDRAGIIGIIDSTMRNLGVIHGVDCTNVANEWFDSIVGLDAASLRALADTSYRSILDRVLV